MLLADKRDLQNSLKVSLLQIEEKELNFYFNNCVTVGTQAALLAGFTFSAIIEINVQQVLASDEVVAEAGTTGTQTLQVIWFVATAMAMILEIFALIKAMQLSILGPGLALRGPEGSVTRALVVMRVEYTRIHGFFYSGLALFMLSIALYTFAMFSQLADGAMSYTVAALISLACLYIFFDFRNLDKQLRLPADVARELPGASADRGSRSSRESNGDGQTAPATIMIDRIPSRRAAGRPAGSERRSLAETVRHNVRASRVARRSTSKAQNDCTRQGMATVFAAEGGSKHGGQEYRTGVPIITASEAHIRGSNGAVLRRTPSGSGAHMSPPCACVRGHAPPAFDAAGDTGHCGSCPRKPSDPGPRATWHTGLHAAQGTPASSSVVETSRRPLHGTAPPCSPLGRPSVPGQSTPVASSNGHRWSQHQERPRRHSDPLRWLISSRRGSWPTPRAQPAASTTQAKPTAEPLSTPLPPSAATMSATSEAHRLSSDAGDGERTRTPAADEARDTLATPKRHAMSTEQPDFAQALTAWWPFREEASAGAPPPAATASSSAYSGSPSDVSMVNIDCSELGGASRSATWSMRADETLRDARDAACNRFQMKSEEVEICIAGVPQSAPWLVNARLGSLRESLVNVGGVWGGPLQLQVRAREAVQSRSPA